LAGIEWLAGSPLGRLLAAELPLSSEWLVPTMIQLELAKWLSRKADEDRIDQVIAFTPTCVVADLDTATALPAAELTPSIGFSPQVAFMQPRVRTALTC
jgi:hypothetical protein